MKTILKRSIHRKASPGITGMLICHDNTVTEVIEGPRRILRSTIAELRRSQVIGHIDIIEDVAIDTREFDDWRVRMIDESPLRKTA